MLRINESKSDSQAKWYYTQGLSAEGEYYAKDQAQQEVKAHWHGQTAAMMGLSGEVRQEDFYSLADHQHPQTGEPLTLRFRRQWLENRELRAKTP